jgi:hypothetical protein
MAHEPYIRNGTVCCFDHFPIEGFEQQAIMLETADMLERITLRYAARFDIPMLRDLKHAVMLLRSHANAINAMSEALSEQHV